MDCACEVIYEKQNSIAETYESEWIYNGKFNNRRYKK